MTENEAQKWLEQFEWDDSEETSEALATICEALQEYPKFKEIGTIEECRNAYAYGYNQGGIDRAEELQKCREYGYNKAIDEAIEASAKAISVGCGYLEGHKCNYKGANCGVSKPMLETVVGALERLKGGAE